ncbi:helix-turn-helix domain-containing protein [Desertivirga xinjiangensis]|uniref:helix-turn-helix domain-containing protein n=1 Tax=Desertivirga xinjiangensis TaxID=539206 RepID=UPI00210A8349|nr:response regulator transcription factor [Pedobacter xinjiangensis]
MSLLLAAVLLSGLFQGLILIMLLLKKEINLLPNRLLASLILLFVIHLGLVAIDVNNHFLLFPHLSKLSWVLPLLYGPLIICLTESIVEIEFRFTRRHLLLLIPFFAYLFILSPYFLMRTDEKLQYLTNVGQVEQDDMGWMNQLTLFIHIAFVSAAFYIFYRKSSHLPFYYSDPGRVRLNWLKHFLIGMLGTIILSGISFYARIYQIEFLGSIYPSNFILLVIMVYWMGYRLIQDPTVFTVSELRTGTSAALVEEGETTSGMKYQKSAVSAVELDKYAQALLNLMDTKKPYLNSNLTINDLCADLFIKRHLLSQVINTIFKKNFFEFVNEYRIKEFKQQVLKESNSHLSILGIALECGFNSKATFNSAFKKAEGVTPSEYIRTL